VAQMGGCRALCLALAATVWPAASADSSVSVIIPTCNRATSVHKAVATVFAQDGVSNIEVVVVDDSPFGTAPQLAGEGSPEVWAATKLVDRRPLPGRQGERASYENGLVYIYSPVQLSIGAKRNLGVSEASKDIIVMWDDDDVLPSGALKERILPILMGEADVTVLTASLVTFVDSGRTLAVADTKFAFEGLSAYPRLRAPVLAGSKPEGRIYEDNSLGEDGEFLWQAFKGCNRVVKVNLTQPWAYVRHGGNTWNGKNFEQLSQLLTEVETPSFIKESELQASRNSTSCSVLNLQAPQDLVPVLHGGTFLTLHSDEAIIRSELLLSPMTCCADTDNTAAPQKCGPNAQLDRYKRAASERRQLAQGDLYIVGDQAYFEPAPGDTPEDYFPVPSSPPSFASPSAPPSFPSPSPATPPSVPPSPPSPASPPTSPPASPPATPATPPSSPPTTATGQGDPHIRGAHGDVFDFKGEDKVVYSMFSARGFAVNARFDHDVYSLGDTEVHGSFITKAYVSVQLPGQKDAVQISFDATRPDLAQLAIGRRRTGLAISPFGVNEANIDTFTQDELVVTLSKPHMNTAVLEVSDGFWRVVCKARLYPYSTTNKEKKRLDISFSQLNKDAAAKVAPHGLVGQTFDGDNIAVDGAQDDYQGKVVVTKAMGEGAIEGTASDYAVPTPFSVDFAYSRFYAEVAAPRDVSKLAGLKKKVEAGSKTMEASSTNDNPTDA